MTRKQHTSTRREIAQPGLWLAADAPSTPWREWMAAELRRTGRVNVPDELLAWLRTQAEELAFNYPENFGARKKNGKKAGALFSLSSAPGNDDAPAFGHWPSAGLVWGGVGIALDLPEGPRRMKVSRLIDGIEKGKVPDRYFLSKLAARGILRRCARMKRSLFPPLQRALEILAKEGERERTDRGEEW